MAFSKIIFNGEVQMDVTQNTVASNNLLQDETATGADGEPVVGAYAVPTGTRIITSPGTYDVSSFASVEVNIDMWTEETISTSGAVTQALEPYVMYHFTGALTSLTVTLGQASGIACYHFDFDCGSTAPTVNIPNTVTMPDSQTFDADNHYEVDILNNYGAVLSWEIS